MTKVKQAEPEGFPEFWAIWRPHRRHTACRQNGDSRGGHTTNRPTAAAGRYPIDRNGERSQPARGIARACSTGIARRPRNGGCSARVR